MLNLTTPIGKSKIIFSSTPLKTTVLGTIFKENVVLFSLEFSGLITGMGQTSIRFDFWKCFYLINFTFIEIYVLKEMFFDILRIRMSDNDPPTSGNTKQMLRTLINRKERKILFERIRYFLKSTSVGVDTMWEVITF